MSTRAFYVLRLKAFLTPKDLGDLAGYTKAQMCNLARANGIPGIRVNPGGKHYRFADTPEIRAWCASKKAERERPRIRRSTAGKTQRRRYEKIERLIDIFIEESPVEKTDKQLALRYFNALAKLAFQRMRFFPSSDSYYRMVWGSGRPPRESLPIKDFPLLEGIRALDHEKLFFRFTEGLSGQPMGKIKFIRAIMEALPIRPEARPHSAAVLAKSQTRP
jgi:hypothetical protein